MTEYTNNNKFVPQAPKTCEVRYVENENKQSGLSPAAKSKIVKRHGGNYQSQRLNETNPGYGPMPDNHGCPQEANFDLTMCASGEYYLGFEGGG